MRELRRLRRRLGEPVLFHYILQHVVGHGDYRLVAYFKVFGGYFNSRRAQFFYFSAQVFDIYNHTAAQNVDDLVAQYARRQKV